MRRRPGCHNTPATTPNTNTVVRPAAPCPLALTPHKHTKQQNTNYGSLRELPDCQLVATNLDDFDHIGRGRTMPGTGCLVRAVEVASGKTAVNVGKGGPWLFPFLAESLGLDPARTAVVGDRLDTDIALAREGGMLAILPRTGEFVAFVLFAVFVCLCVWVVFVCWCVCALCVFVGRRGGHAEL